MSNALTREQLMANADAQNAMTRAKASADVNVLNAQEQANARLLADQIQSLIDKGFTREQITKFATAQAANLGVTPNQLGVKTFSELAGAGGTVVGTALKAAAK